MHVDVVLRDTVWDQVGRGAVLQNCLTEVRHQADAGTCCTFELLGLQGRSADEMAPRLQMMTHAVFGSRTSRRAVG